MAPSSNAAQQQACSSSSVMFSDSVLRAAEASIMKRKGIRNSEDYLKGSQPIVSAITLEPVEFEVCQSGTFLLSIR